MAFVPLMAGFGLNAYSLDEPHVSILASNTKGNYVSAWEQPGEGSTQQTIRVQRYDPTGKAIGNSIQVDAENPEIPSEPAVAMTSSGGFVVVWKGTTEGGASSIRARVFNSAGAALGKEIVVASSSSNDLKDPAVAISKKGSFTVTWTGNDANGNGIFARQYSPKGVASKSFAVNTYTSGNQSNPAIALDAKGQALITWQSANQDGSGQGIFAQRMGPTGKKAGAEFRVNSNRKGNQQLPAVAVNSKGTFIVSWTTDRQDGDGYGVVARKFLANGSSKEGEFLVNTATSGNQILPTIATSAKNEFLVGWTSLHADGGLLALSARKLDATGKAVGDQFDAPEVAGFAPFDKVYTLLETGEIQTAMRLFPTPLFQSPFIQPAYPSLISLQGSGAGGTLYSPATPVTGMLRVDGLSNGTGFTLAPSQRLITNSSTTGGTKIDLPLTMLTGSGTFTPAIVVGLTNTLLLLPSSGAGRVELDNSTPVTDGVLVESGMLNLSDIPRLPSGEYVLLEYPPSGVNSSLPPIVPETPAEG